MKRFLLLSGLLAIGATCSLHADTAVVFNEIMYHPATNEPALEWVELRNQLAVDVDISEWSITGGIDYRFASNTIVKGRGFLVVAVSPAAFTAATGATNVVGPFTGRLGNDGEQLRLRNNSGRGVDEVNYGASGDWPVAPDGSGASLAKRDRDSASATAVNWTASAQMGGTPGVDNFPLLNTALPDTTLIAVEQPWKFDASGADLGSAWRGTNFTDNTWASGPAWLYNGSISAGESRPNATLFNTGVGTNGVALAQGAADPHYVLSAAAQGTVGAAATAMANNTAWLANDPASTWIGVVNSGALNVNAGGFDFLTRFTLDSFLPGSAQVSFQVAVDNDLTNVFLNGAPLGIAYSGFAGLSGIYTMTNGFVAGTNTLEFRTVNAGTTANPGGFRAVVNGSGLVVITNTPLPAGANTYYFRKAFTFSGNVTNTELRLRAIIDDGAIFYLNGVEVHRQNMPAGTISAATPALTNIASPAYSAPILIPAGSLVVGQNLLAVEVHQAAGGAGDALFGAELISTPAAPPPVPLAFNEVSASTNAEFWVELINHGSSMLVLDGYVIARDGPVNGEYVFPTGRSIASGGYLALTNTTLGFKPIDGDKLLLLPPARDKVIDAIVLTRGPRARSPEGTGAFLRPNAPTPGAANSFGFRGEVVINEIMHSPHLLTGTNGLPPRSSPEEWIELYNRSASPVDLTGWELDGGVQYIFTPGKTLAPGAYLVIADDVLFLKGLYPGIDIVGDYSGRLSSSDRILLKDPTGNPADEVRYFGDIPWPEYAAGGGSSLELRDPNSDNSRAEAWAASDETGKSSWQTYTYRMTANIPSGSGQPTQWQDFILGLQSAGECLIDDLSVLQSPTNSPIQVISNGNFDNGLTGWRVLGTHNRSRVEPEPGNAGNSVLHLIATGPQEHMHNHIEATLAGGRTIVPGALYEISFRARWLAGNNLLNTRLYFNRVARTTALPIPLLNGTPGAQNSRFAANVGPTFSNFGHRRVVPAAGEPVTVSIVAQDPQGVASVQVFWSVNSGTWNNVTMSAEDGSHYTGTIPGQPASAVVQFYVQATDGLGASATYPARGTNSGALYKVNDSSANLPLAHNVRIILTPANTDLMHGNAQGVNQTNVMSNDLIPCTVIYDEQRAYYDCGVHLRGSQRGRYSDVRTGFHINFPADDLFRGVHPVMLIDRSGAGDAVDNRQEEIVLKHILNRAGNIPGTYSEICRLLAPRSAHTGSAQFFPRHEDVFIESAFEDGGAGQMWEMELIYYPTSANASGYKNPQPDNVVGTDITDLGPDKEIYRYNFMTKNHRDEDDYRSLIALGRAWSQPAGSAALDAQTRQLMDIDQWMRAYALVSLCSVGDMYTFGNNHNWFMYVRPSDGKWLYFPWDMDFAFTGGATRALVGTDAVNLPKVVNLPANLRCLYAHMLDIINVSFNTNYMAYWTAHYASLAPGQNYANSLNTIGGRAPFVRTTINAATGTNFTVGTNFISTSNNLVTLTGTAAAQVKTILINGVEYPVTWTTVSAWRIAIPLSEATNNLTLTTVDVRGNVLTNFTRTVTVHYLGAPVPEPEGSVVINEIMYNPVAPEAGYIELFNASTNFSYDLSGWRINGIDYTFPSGSILASRQFLVLAANQPVFAAAYSTNTPASWDQFGGNLQNDGETLSLVRPGVNPGEEIIVDRVRYESVRPWPTAANGTGPSLQLADANQDNARVSNWGAGFGWQFVSRTGNIVNGTNLFVWLTQAGNAFVDDISLVGPAGTNILQNAGFESGALAPWLLSPVYSNSTVVSGVSHSGNHSLFIQGSGAGGGQNVIQQIITDLVEPNGVYTLSLYALHNTNPAVVNLRPVPGNNLTTNVTTAPVQFTPGTLNSFVNTLPPYDPLWLNEILPNNLSGITDNNGEREPWIELYNAGSGVIDLSGYYLANNYDTNLTQWPFPAGSSIAPGEFRLIWADGQPGQTSGTNLHTSFRLDPGAGSLALVRMALNSPQITDYLSYSNVTAGKSFGDYPDGQPFFRQEFFVATPRVANNNAAAPIVAVINEWMAANVSGLLNTNNGNRRDDWFELYNPGASPVNLAGYYLTDNLVNRFQFAIPSGYIIPANGYLLVWADGASSLNTNTDQALHVNFRLDAGGEQIGLFAGDGTMIDGVAFEPQFDDVSQGRVPNGTGPAYFLLSATPRAPNTSWANRYPVLAPIHDETTGAGITLSFVAHATDPEAPPQVLNFSLAPGAPTNAMIHPVTGVFSFTPNAAQAMSTNVITVNVTDNGTPPLRASQTFRVIVGLHVNQIAFIPGGGASLTFGTIAGRTYRVEYKNDLSDPQWLPVGADTLANSNTLTLTDNTGAHTQRFYRILQVD